jgi:hypothetical protein
MAQLTPPAALRYIHNQAVEVVRGMRLDVLHPAATTVPVSATSHAAFFGGTGVETGDHGPAAAAASSSVRSSSNNKPGLLRSPTLLSNSNRQASSSVRLTRGGAGNGTLSGTQRPEDLHVAACQHLLYALHELVLWEGGEIDADGEIQRRDGVSFFPLGGGGGGGDDASVRLLYHHHGQDKASGGSKKGPIFSSASAAGGGGGSVPTMATARPRGRSALMEKDEDSFDRDLTWRRRELLRNCHVVEGLLMFTSVAFQLYRGRTYARTRAELLAAAARGDAAAVAMMAATDGGGGRGGNGSDAPLPDAHLLSPDAIPLVDACCRYAYRLLRGMMTSSCALTVLYLAGVNSMVRACARLEWR